ncbi:MAG: potassium channel protein [Bryobacteraceae bacterium]|nr:potassium channel protein [Bryobacteraceae bacterium]
MDLIRRRAVWIGLTLAAILAVGTAGYVLIADFPLFDAFYMALITITTVGYAEVQPLGTAGRAFNAFYIFIGVSAMFAAIGTMTETIIELQLGNFLGKRRARRMIENLKDHIIVCGFGRVGRGASAELQQAAAPFLVVDRNPDKVERAIKSGMLAVLADSTRDETLRDAGIARARGIIAALSTDADNLFLTLSAKSLNPKVIVSARVSEEENESKLRRAGADSVIAPYAATGTRLAQSLLRPHVTQFLNFTTSSVGEDIGIEQVQVGLNSDFVAKTLQQLPIRRELGVIVLAIRRTDGQMQFNPAANAEIGAGDCLIVMGEHASLRKLERMAEARHESAHR